MSAVVTLLLNTAIALFLVFQFILRLGVVVGASMEPTFYDGAVLLINRLSTGRRGSVVVARIPDCGMVAKRVIAVGGDSVRIESGVVYVNGDALAELYVSNFDADDNVVEIVLPRETYFVAGDNRPRSFDSRNGMGLVDEEDIIGAVLLSVGGKRP